MRKLKLDPDTLRVDSFAAQKQDNAPKGTVRAQSYVTFDPWQACSEPASQYCMETDYHWYTCGNSCINACFLTGNDPTCIN
ncbi:MAG TPA: hypothetical protein VF092_01720 [Longimicrobium sp.]